MSAYAALVSLHKILVIILYTQPRIIHNRVQLQSLLAQVDLLLNFLDVASTYVAANQMLISELETKMRDAAHKAVDLIDNGTLNYDMRNSNSFLFSILLCFMLVPLPATLEMIPGWIPYIVVEVVSSIINAFLLYTWIRHIFWLPTTNASQKSRQVLYDFDIIVKEVIRTKEARGDEPEVSAYVALISLRQILDSILNDSGGGLRMSRNRAHLKSLKFMVIFLLKFLENASASSTQNLDAKIRDAVYKAKIALIEFQLPRKFGAEFEWRRFCTLQNVVLLLVPAVFVTMFRYDMNTFPYSLIVSPPQIKPTWYGILGKLCVASAYYTSIVLIVFAVLEAQYNSEAPENSELPHVVDNFNIFVRYVIEVAYGNPTDLRPAAAAAVSRHDLGGTDKDDPVGFRKDLIKMNGLLLQDSSKRQLASIVGIGGIGKTTLARQVYKDPNIVNHFDVRAWVTVSQEYSLRHVLLCLLHSGQMLKEVKPEDNDDKLALNLHQYLVSRRYLIVIDDVWDIEIWDFLSRFFPENNNGSRILITSRLSNVANFLDSSSALHHMQHLNVEDSWKLLQTEVFGVKLCPPEMESIGRGIAQNCGGIPLAIVVIGGLLKKDVQIEIWRDVAEKLIRSELEDIMEQCLEILGLSYKHLPHRLRPCFLYIGVQPRDCEIHISKLINLWVAEGFLQTCESKTLEAVAEDYINDLVERNLILVCKKNCHGRMRTCSVHDLLRGVCVENARKEKFRHVVESGGYVIARESPDESPCSLSTHPNTLQVDDIHGYLGFLQLRVLNVLGIQFGEFPHQITKLVRLRYLAFQYDGSLPLPPSILKLRHLETIVLHHSSFDKYSFLPSLIWKMSNLRHIYVKPGYYMFKPLGYQFVLNYSLLVNLHTLVGIRNFKWTKGIIEKIPNLKKLGISYDVSSSMYSSKYQLENLVYLHQLESLKLIIKYDHPESVMSCDPPKLAFPQKLKKLSLCGCRIPWASMTAIGALPNLEALKLRREAFSGLSWETIEGEFPQLVFLLLEEINFTSWRTDETHFPRLQRLIIRLCVMLEEIPSSIGDIPTLEKIQLDYCHPSAVASANEIQEYQKSMGNEVEFEFHSEQRRRVVDGMNLDAKEAGPGVFQVLNDAIQSTPYLLLIIALMTVLFLATVLAIVLVSLFKLSSVLKWGWGLEFVP